MALILALNPGNSHTPTLARLARELKGVELIGADSCPTAIKAIKERVPDLVLLPARQAPGEADLIAQLKKVPGGVLTVKLPPVDQADPVDLAQQIREILTGSGAFTGLSEPGFGAASAKAATVEQAEVGASPQLIAAATAAIGWIRARRAQWSEPRDAYATHEPSEPEYYEPIPLSDEPEDIAVAREPNATNEVGEADDPESGFAISRAAGAVADIGGTVVSWLPKVAALMVVIGIAGALVSYWPQISGAIGSVQQFDRPAEPTQPTSSPKPAVPEPAAKPAAEPDPMGNVSGWVAVFAPFEITISEGTVGVPLDDRGRAMLAPGRHRLRFQNSELGYDETRTVQVRPTETTTINLTPETTLAVTSNEPAEVLIDGTRAGETPFEGRISLGTHTVTVRTAGGERQLTVAATSKPVQLEVDFSKP